VLEHRTGIKKGLRAQFQTRNRNVGVAEENPLDWSLFIILIELLKRILQAVAGRLGRISKSSDSLVQAQLDGKVINRIPQAMWTIFVMMFFSIFEETLRSWLRVQLASDSDGENT
jgi:hypothetical protein